MMENCCASLVNDAYFTQYCLPIVLKDWPINLELIASVLTKLIKGQFFPYQPSFKRPFIKIKIENHSIKTNRLKEALHIRQIKLNKKYKCFPF